MSARRNGLIVLAIQLALVLSIGVKYAWERHHCPMVWTLSEQYDPSQPLRGRYLALGLFANACGLPHVGDVVVYVRNPAGGSLSASGQHWRVIPAARDGQLAAVIVEQTRPGLAQDMTLPMRVDC